MSVRGTVPLRPLKDECMQRHHECSVTLKLQSFTSQGSKQQAQREFDTASIHNQRGSQHPAQRETARTAIVMPSRVMKSKIPITVVTGFLGSGKTTLVNYILKEQHGKKIAVIENEFGEVGVDDALVLQTQEEVFEMNNGCICCTVRGDLIRILNKLIRRKTPFDAILIETTGLADPAPVVQTFFVDEEIQDACRLDAVLTVVDAKHIMQHLEEERPEGVENESVEQVAFADRILLNKIDLVTAEEKQNVIKKIKGINGAVEIIESEFARVPLDQLLGIGAFSLDRVLEAEPDFLDPDKEHQHDTSVTSVGIEEEGECDVDLLNNWLRKLLAEKGAELYRSKGVLCIEDSPHKYVFQGVHMLLQMGSSAEGHGHPWAPGEKRVNRLVFIGRNLDRQALVASFKACIVKSYTVKSRK